MEEVAAIRYWSFTWVSSPAQALHVVNYIFNKHSLFAVHMIKTYSYSKCFHLYNGLNTSQWARCLGLSCFSANLCLFIEYPRWNCCYRTRVRSFVYIRDPFISVSCDKQHRQLRTFYGMKTNTECNRTVTQFYF